MIFKLVIGKPFETEAVVDESDVNTVTYDSMEELLGRFGASLERGNNIRISFGINENTVIYGLGESNRGLNKKGYLYRSDNSDEPDHTEDKVSLYGSHNFILVKNEDKVFGLFIDHPETIEWDLGYSDINNAIINAPADDIKIYLLTGVYMRDISFEFRKMIGRSYIAPVWSFGYQQSRWGYKCADDIREVVNGYRKAGIPLDAVYLDIDYMQDYKDFTVNKERFPAFKDFVQEMTEQGIHLVPIIDAGVKIEKGYDVYDEGVEKGYFCTNKDKSFFKVGVWPGWTHFPDFFRPEVRRWFGDLYGRLTDCGIDGFWNDMNEPAMFYSEKSIEDIYSSIRSFDWNDADEINPILTVRAQIDGLKTKDNHKLFYHVVNGERVPHEKVHNLFGTNMTKAAAEGLERLRPGKKSLLFSRSSYIGMHRYSGIWQGDNHSWWSHILSNLQMMANLNMCGFLYTGADVCGFGANTTEDLALRWIALGIFTPLFRNHSAIYTREQEVYKFENVNVFKEMISLRYRLIPYLYSEYLKSANNSTMMFRPLSFDFEEDERALNVDDQLLLGDELMIAPVYTQNAKGRYVYLPEDMLYLCFKNAHEYTAKPLSKGDHYIEVPVDCVPMFLRKGRILPLGVAEVCTADMRRYNDAGSRGELNREDFEIISFVGGGEYELYTDVDDEIKINIIKM